MSDEIKFIFKTLIKVPCIIFVAFFILNVFSFFFIYFKALGMSYVVMQTAAENNYLPPSELTQIVTSLNGWTINIANLEDAGVIVSASGTEINTTGDAQAGSTSEADARHKRQYGSSVTCGVYCDYTIIWPLDYRETTKDNAGVNGLGGNNFKGFKSEAELEDARNNEKHRITIPIKITYTIPGLKYYPDLLVTN